ncbi:hypothetical protein [Dasania marina]|uniref:hypothetical protein n=1 Tax=Dasania marina TaxID=471499 RepID=UPI0012E9DA4A|nr:hypothetical protein [Dasania marina]
MIEKITKTTEHIQLMEQFPSLGLNRLNPYMLSLPLGWMKSVTEICQLLSDYKKETGNQVKVTQIKEKFGSLRFYYRAPKQPAQLYETIEQLCLMTEEICAYCGSKGKIKHQDGYYMMAVCDKHYIPDETDYD